VWVGREHGKLQYIINVYNYKTIKKYQSFFKKERTTTPIVHEILDHTNTTFKKIFLTDGVGIQKPVTARGRGGGGGSCRHTLLHLKQLIVAFTHNCLLGCTSGRK
jgi:hypothetical protein